MKTIAQQLQSRIDRGSNIINTLEEIQAEYEQNHVQSNIKASLENVREVQSLLKRSLGKIIGLNQLVSHYEKVINSEFYTKLPEYVDLYRGEPSAESMEFIEKALHA